MTPTKAPKTTFTATYVHPTTGETITVTRTSHRIYTHGSVRGPYSDGAYGVTFHGSEAQAARKNEYGPVALVVELTSDRNYNAPAKAKATPAPVEVEQPGTVATKTTTKKKSSTKTTSAPVEPSTDLPAPGTGHLIGYGRVSTKDQDAQLQRDAFAAAGCIRVFEDTASGKSTKGRPELAAALEYLRPGDVLVAWKLDRIARSVVDLINLVDGLTARGIGFRVLTGALSSIDTTKADGRLFMTIIGGMAEFERSLIVERTRAGLESARAEGRVGGRPSVIDEDKLAIALARRAKGESVSSIAKALGVSRATLYNHLGAAESTSTTE